MLFFTSWGVAGFDRAIEVTSSVLGVVVSGLTVITLLVAIFVAPPFFKAAMARDYLKSTVKAMQVADEEVYKESILMIDSLELERIENAIVTDNYLRLQQENISKIRDKALLGKRSSLTLLELLNRLLRNLKVEVEGHERSNTKLTEDRVKSLINKVLLKVTTYSMAIQEIPETSDLEFADLYNSDIKGVTIPKVERFKDLPRGLDFRDDSPIPLSFVELANNVGGVHIQRACAIAINPVPYFARLMEYQNIYVPLVIYNSSVKSIYQEEMPITCIGFKDGEHPKTGQKTFWVQYSQLDRGFLVFENGLNSLVRGTTRDGYLGSAFFEEFPLERAKKNGLESFVLEFDMEKLKGFYPGIKEQFEKKIEGHA